MADFAAHHLFGEQVATALPAPAQRAAACHPTCFYWGCQGPDPLFYRNILGGSPLHKLGNRMHSERTPALFSALSRAASCLSGEAHEIALAYLYGFLCHYALDSAIHPYVYCRQEQLRSGNAKLSASAVHCQIESDIDYVLYRQATGQPVTTFEPREYYTLERQELAVLGCLLHAVLRIVYGETVPTREVRGAFTDMLAWEDFLFSDSRGLYFGAQRLEQLVGRGALLTGHMKVEAPTWDCLNDEHLPWRNLWQPAAIRVESVPELLEAARTHAVALVAAYLTEAQPPAFDVPFDNGNPKKILA